MTEENALLRAKMDDFIPGMPDDPGELPELLYQAVLGRVFTVTRYPNDTTVRGEISLEQLEDILGGKVIKEGWYTATGAYLGAHPPGSLVAE